MRIGGAIAELRRFAAEAPAAIERCDGCAAALVASHPHWLEPRSRRMRCVCGLCAAPPPPWRFVRRRIVALGELDDDAGAWDGLGAPVGLSFVVLNGNDFKPSTYFPGPAGVTASSVDASDWARLGTRVPCVGAMQHDVEAFLVHRLDGAREHYIVSIDVCYHLVGQLRRHGRSWGGEVRREVDVFMTSLKREAAHA